MSLSGARVVVTGAGGFLGGHLLDALRAVGADAIPVTRKECDLREPDSTQWLFQTLSPEYVIHAAAVGGGIGWMGAHPATALVENLVLNTNVLEASRRAGVRRIVGISSACAYAADAAQPMCEADIFSGAPEPSNGPYGHAKRVMLVHGAALHAEFGVDCAFVVPTNLYGPGEDFSPERSHLVGAMVRRLDDARRAGAASVTCWGSGTATRDLLHARDAAEAIVALLTTGGGPAPVNLGSGQERTIAEIASEVAQAVGYDGSLSWDTTKPDGMRRKVLDTTLARRRLGWHPRISLSDGLAETVSWFRSSCS